MTDLDMHMGTWTFQRGSVVGREVVAALSIIEFLQDLAAPNVVQAAQKYGPFKDYHDIPEREPQFPDSLMGFLRALATIQAHTPTPIVIPDLTTVTVGQVRAVTQAAALVSGQTVVDTWDRVRTVQDGSLTEAGPEQEINLANHYQLLIMKKLVVNVGEQTLTIGTVASLLLSARYAVEGNQLVARPFRNNTVQKTFSPLADVAGPFDRRVLAKEIGRIDEPSSEQI
jgi:hypothetical protein